MPQYKEHILLLGGIVSTGVRASSMHHPDEHYDHLYAAIKSGAKIERITLVYGKPVEGFFGLLFTVYDEQKSGGLEKKILKLNQRDILVGFGPRLDDFLQKDRASLEYKDRIRRVQGLRALPVRVPKKYESLSMEEIFENARQKASRRRMTEV